MPSCWPNLTLCSVQLEMLRSGFLPLHCCAGRLAAQVSRAISALLSQLQHQAQWFCVWLLLAAVAPGSCCLLQWAVAHLALLDA